MTSTPVVLDACALVDLLLRTPNQTWVEQQLAGRPVVAPGHMLVEVLNAIGKNVRRGGYDPEVVPAVLRDAALLPHEIVPLSSLLEGGWARRDQHPLADALYVELAAQLDTVVITTDRRLARATPLAVAPPDIGADVPG